MTVNNDTYISPVQAQVGQVFHFGQAFQLESGGVLPELKLCYSTYGKLNEGRNNVIWVCHALTGNANVTEWWEGIFGDGCLFDTREYFVVCANVLGSCYGSTGPLDTNPLTGKPYFGDFPDITMRDVVRSFDLLRRHLQIEKIHTCIGGSLGGQQALEWAVSHPSLIEHLIVLATNARTSPWGIALNETQRMAMRTDKTFGLPYPEAGQEGMKAARAVALLSYRSYETYQKTQTDPVDELWELKAISYQQYQGNKFATRFNAYSYWAMTRLLDSHNVGRKRGSIEAALNNIEAKTLVIGISTDVLFPTVEQEFLASHINGAQLHLISSLYGHDGFLMETKKIAPIISDFYQT